MSVRQQYISFLVLGLLAVFLGTLAWQDASNAWPTNEEKTLLKTFLFYEGWLMFLFLPLVIWGFKHKKVSMGFFLISVIGMVFVVV